MSDRATEAAGGTRSASRDISRSRWAAWFDGMSLTNESDGTTSIRGPVTDQAALHGLLQRLRDTGLPLISVTQLDPIPHRIHDRPRKERDMTTTVPTPAATRPPIDPMRRTSRPPASCT